MTYKYAFQNFDKNTMARASGTNLTISLKKTVETAKELSGKKVSTAINYLERVANLKAVVPYRTYRGEMGHKRGKGIDTGGFPVKVSNEIVSLLQSAKKNAEDLGLDENLYVLSVSGRKGSSRYKPGRYSGRKAKATSVEVIIGSKPAKKVKEAKSE
jgi:ribosomal protein uL22